jgi:hypothetical protein
MKSPIYAPLFFAAVLMTGTAVAQSTASPSTPAAPVAPPSSLAPATPGSPETPVAPGTLPERPAPGSVGPSSAQTTPTAGQTAVPSGEAAKAQQTGQSAHGGVTTEGASSEPPATQTEPSLADKHGKTHYSKNKAARPTPTVNGKQQGGPQSTGTTPGNNTTTPYGATGVKP